MEGWNKDYLSEVMDVLNECYDTQYEINNCIRGCHTGCRTYEDLGDYLRCLSDKLRMAAEYVDSSLDMMDEEEDED